MSQLKKGALLSYVTIFLTNIIGLVLTPFIIKSLGGGEYGLYLLIGALIANITILNLGLNNTVIRFVSKYRAEADKQGEENFLGSVLLIYFFLSILVIVVGAVVYYNFSDIFSNALNPEEIEKGKWMLVILIFNLAISLPGGTFEAICNAYEHFVFPRAVNIIKYLSRAILIFALLGFLPNAITLIWIDTILNLIIISVTIFYAFKKLKVKITIGRLNPKLLKNIFSYTIWVFVYAVVYRLQWHSGQTILGITADTLTVAIFGVGVMLGGYYGAFAGAINSLLLPKATKMTVNNSTKEEYTNLMIKVGRINAFLLLAILSGFILFGSQFIKLWVGDFYTQAWEIALLIMIVMTIPLLQSFGNNILEAKKKNRFKSLLSLFTMTIAVVLAFYLSKDYGLRGVIYPICIVFFINSIFMFFYYKKIFGFQIARFFIDTLLKPAIFILPLVLFVKYLTQYFLVDNWSSFILVLLVYSILYFLLIYFLVMRKEEKSIFQDLIKN